MPEHRRPADEFIAVEYRHEDEEVIDMRNRSTAQIRIVEEDDIPGVDRTVEGVHHLPDIRAELTDDHAAVRITDHRKLIVLLPNDR